MKEIDFLPDWYRNGKRRRISYQTQYAAILCILLAMAGWSFFTARWVSTSQAQVNEDASETKEVERAGQEYKTLQNEISTLNAKAQTLSKLDPRICVADVLGELGFLIDSRILITQIKLDAQALGGANQKTDGIRVAQRNSQHSGTMQGDARFKVVINGLAADASDVAKLICKLEGSHYFTQVIPGFSRTKEIKSHQVSEFEISCYIANYREKQVK